MQRTLAELRRRAGLKQEAAAQAAGLDRSQLSKYERGHHRPGKPIMTALAKIYQVSLVEVEDAASNTKHLAAAGHLDAFDKTEDWEQTPNAALRRLVEYDVRLSAGFGAVATEEAAVDEWAVPRTWLPRLQGTQAECVVVEVIGDSMSPEFQPGDKVLVDTADRRPTPPGYFALWDGLGTVIKQVEHIPHSDPPTLRIKSRNPEYETYEREAAEVQIAGRVIGLMRRL